jgi:hypothetical protein
MNVSVIHFRFVGVVVRRLDDLLSPWVCMVRFGVNCQVHVKWKDTRTLSRLTGVSSYQRSPQPCAIILGSPQDLPSAARESKPYSLCNSIHS